METRLLSQCTEGGLRKRSLPGVSKYDSWVHITEAGGAGQMGWSLVSEGDGVGYHFLPGRQDGIALVSDRPLEPSAVTSARNPRRPDRHGLCRGLNALWLSRVAGSVTLGKQELSW